MARWMALVKLPDRPSKREAEQVAEVLHGEELIAVVAVVDWKITEEERRARRQRKEREEDREC